jgi:uncharacterized membrane protein YfhO
MENPDNNNSNPEDQAGELNQPSTDDINAVDAETAIKEEPIIEEGPDFFERLGNKAIWFALGLAACIILYVYKDFIFLQNTLLFKDIGSDSVNETWPAFIYLSDQLSKNGITFWSHQFGMGDTVYQYYTDPFNLVVLLFDKSNIAYVFVFQQIISILITVIITFYYLKELGLKSFSCIFGSLVYSFSGFLILGSCGWYLAPQALYFMLSLFAIERYLKNNSLWLICFAAFLLACNSAFYGIQVFAFSFFYLFIRLLEIDGINRFFRIIILRQFWFSILFILGFLIAGFIFINYLDLVLTSGRALNTKQTSTFATSNPFALVSSNELQSIIARFFSNDLLGTSLEYKGWMNYFESPLIYMGLITVILFVYGSIKGYGKSLLINRVLLFIVLVSFAFPYIRYAFWGFQLNYFRVFSFFLAFILFFISIRTFDKVIIERSINRNYILLIGFLIAIILFTNTVIMQSNIENTVRNKVFLFLFVYLLLFYLIDLKKSIVEIKYALLVVLCIEIGTLTDITVNNRSLVTSTDLNSKVGYNDETNDAINYLNKIDKNYYRIIKMYSSGGAVHLSLNDALIQNFMGVVSYSQFQKKGYLGFLELNGLFDNKNSDELKWSSKIISKVRVCSFAAGKYFLDKPPLNNFDTLFIKPIFKVSNTVVLKNELALPLFYLQDNIINETDIRKIQPNKRINILYFAAVVKNSDALDLPILRNLNDTLFDNKNNLRDRANYLNSNPIIISKFIPDLIELEVNATKNTLMCSSIPEHDGWLIMVDGKPAVKTIVNGGLIGLKVSTGKHNVVMKFSPPKLKFSILVSLLSLIVVVLIIILNFKFKLCKNLFKN